MIQDDPRPPLDPIVKTLGIVLATALITAIATKAVDWAYEELRARFAPKPKEPDVK